MTAPEATESRPAYRLRVISIPASPAGVTANLYTPGHWEAQPTTRGVVLLDPVDDVRGIRPNAVLRVSETSAHTPLSVTDAPDEEVRRRVMSFVATPAHLTVRTVTVWACEAEASDAALPFFQQQILETRKLADETFLGVNLTVTAGELDLVERVAASFSFAIASPPEPDET